MGLNRGGCTGAAESHIFHTVRMRGIFPVEPEFMLDEDGGRSVSCATKASRWRTPTIIEPWTQRVCDQEHEERAQNGVTSQSIMQVVFRELHEIRSGGYENLRGTSLTRTRAFLRERV